MGFLFGIMGVMLENQKLIHMKSLSKLVLTVYLLMLLWLVLFKFSFDILSVIAGHQSRSLNWVPFTGHMREMIDNFVTFIPFGLLLSVNFKETNFQRKLIAVFVFSIAVEATQFVLAIGVTDITDVLTNTLGGLCGLLGYAVCKKYVDPKHLDRFIIAAGILLVVLFLALRLFVFRVRY
jgi:glycopeptide antibiotics resistance protein